MADTMYDAPGIGLAANQVGNRTVIVDWREGDAPELWKMINPGNAGSQETAKLEEGCLSIPGRNSEVIRPAEVQVRYLGIDGNIHEMQAEGLLAAVQHEGDHLNGVFLSIISRA